MAILNFTKCTHGTSKDCAEKIKDTGFDHSTGVRGRGIYFWNQDPFNFILAKAWVKQRTGIKNGTVIEVCSSADENLILDTENPDFQKGVVELARAKQWDLSSTDGSKRAWCALIAGIEAQKGCKFSILKCKVQPPSRTNFDSGNTYPSEGLGNPGCIIICDIQTISSSKYIEF